MPPTGAFFLVRRKVSDRGFDRWAGQGVTEGHALARTEDLQNVCRWCDEFLEQHFEGPLLPLAEPASIEPTSTPAAGAA